MSVERELGELTVAVSMMAEQMQRDREERIAHRAEIHTRLNDHSRQLKIFHRIKNYGAGIVATISAIATGKIVWGPF